MARALLVDKSADGARVALTDVAIPAPDPGQLSIALAYSSLNYKDALALAANPGVARTLPLIPGVDGVGTVTADPSGRFTPGQQVIVGGGGIGERRHGCYAETVNAPLAATISLPTGLSARHAAAIGTAGFTAALSVLALADAGIEPGTGDILVTGATGGVGSIAVALLASRGYSVTAATGRVSELTEYLERLGAAHVLDRHEFDAELRPLEKARWAGVVDTLGGRSLAHALAQTAPYGVVAASGLAQDSDLPTTVFPFILRGVTLTGINSVDAPIAIRERSWRLLADELDRDLLDSMIEEIALADAGAAGAELLENRRHGRAIVRVR